MAGVLCALAGSGGGNAISVTVGSDGFFDPKSGNGVSQGGYANAANAISGVTIGGVSPSTLSGATINALYFLADTGGATTLYLVLNGDQTALGFTSIEIDSTTYTLGAASFSGGQTTWSATATGGSFATSPDTARIS